MNLVRPTVQATGGRPGVRRFYSFRDLVQLKVVITLLNSGLSLQKVRRAYSYLRKKADLDTCLSEVKLVTDGHSVFQMFANDNELEDLLREGQLAFFLAIDQASETEPAQKIGHLYDREEFVETLRRVEGQMEQQLRPEVRDRVRSAVAS